MNNYGGSSSSGSRSTSGYNLSSQHGFHSAFGSNHDNGNAAPPILDPSEFPSLTTGRISSSGQGDNVGVLHSSTMPAGKPYGKHSPFKSFDQLFSSELKSLFSVNKLSGKDMFRYKQYCFYFIIIFIIFNY